MSGPNSFADEMELSRRYAETRPVSDRADLIDQFGPIKGRVVSLIERMEDSDHVIISGLGLAAAIPLLVYECAMQAREEESEQPERKGVISRLGSVAGRVLDNIQGGQ
jgi:hypothetical protein